ncbi:DUF5695 domain-containing protein [Sphingomonas sp.]|uniref:DUF5695 domain-containing protein n=1 Tax=Sphingomonas sp. TaxID=28214 RepID=UPI0025F2E830|nr:DUF5695 domain-containing protein [Sphingomonas sp.]
MTRLRFLLPTLALAGVSASAFLATAVSGQEQPKPAYPPIATRTYMVGDLRIALREDTGTLARLSPAGEPTFDFTPGGREAERQGDGYVHLGDINLRVRTAGGAWQDYASSRARRPIRTLPTARGTISAADITASLGGTPLAVERRWVDAGGKLALRFTLINRGEAPVEIGGLGLPMVFDNILIDRNLETAHTQASFVDPYIGRDAGYLQVTRLSGKGSALLVLPEAGSPLEAYRPILQDKVAAEGDIFTDRSPRGQTSEGFYDWTIASKGFVDKEWKNAAEQWNAPTSITLAPGAHRTVGVRFVQAPSIRAIETTLTANRRPVAIGLPGYVVPTDQEASLFLNSPKPVKAIAVFPAAALSVTAAGTINGWRRYTVAARQFGRARVSITYADGSVQTVSYFVTKPLAQTMADIGRFSTTKQFYDDRSDPFNRAPAILSYDRDADKILTQEPRVWIAGMSDEGGGGAWVAAMMKQLDNPDAGEIARLERVVNETVVGKLQIADGPQAGAVKKSIFYYEPGEFPGYYDQEVNWKSWTSWSRKDAGDLGRAYNYPHVAIGHWVLYRIARNHSGLVKVRSWRWYLDHAYQTTVAMMRDAPYYTQFGLMEGDVFVDILKDLKREGLTEKASNMEALMKTRADRWRAEPYPFGSEMPWDSTGQAEVYAWMRYFGYEPQADATREVILAYDPAIPHWGYNGNARRYWDFLYGGKVARIERQIHHYGSTLNAVPLFDAYRRDPADTYLLRVAYGGMMGGITNIDQTGFSSAAFHSAPDMLKWDAYTGDYGMGFYGHALTAATYLVKDPTFGWLGYGGKLTQARGGVTIHPGDGARSRLFVAPAGLWVTLDAGKIASARYMPATGRITLTLDPATPATPAARLLLETTTATGRRYAPTTGTPDRGGYTIALRGAPIDLELTPR